MGQTSTHPQLRAFLAILIAMLLATSGLFASGTQIAEAKALKAPAKVKITSVVSKSPGKATVKVKKAKRAKGYQYKISQKKSFKGKTTVTAKTKKRAKTFSGLKAGKKYYVKVRAYAKSGKKVKYGKWSAVKTVKVKKKPGNPTNSSPSNGEGDVPGKAEFGTLAVDEDSFVVGAEDQRATFTVEVKGWSGAVTLENTLGKKETMRDDGTAGDATAGDGVFTHVDNSKAQSASQVDYWASAGGSKSNVQTLYWFEQPDEEAGADIEAAVEKIEDGFGSIEEGYTDNNGCVSADSVESELDEAEKLASSLQESGEVVWYERSDSSVALKLESGISMVHAPKVAGTWNAVGDPEAETGESALSVLSVPADSATTAVTVQPYYNWVSGLNEGYLPLPSGADNEAELPGMAADSLTAEFTNCSYPGSSKLRGSAVSLDTVKAFAGNQVILWQGHGVYGGCKYNSLICTGHEFTRVSWLNPAYFWDCVQGRIVNWDGEEAFSSKYVDAHCGDMSGSIVYLGPCQSCKDGGVLARSFLNKGAVGVIANTQSIACLYGDLMQWKTVSLLSQVNESTGLYHTLGEALTAAKKEYGESDTFGGEGAVPTLYGGSKAKNHRLSNAKPESGTLASGTWGTCPWTIDEDGVLTISGGKGANTNGSCPWDEYSGSIKKVVVGTDSSTVVFPADSSNLFAEFYNALEIRFKNVNTLNTTDMSYMFACCDFLTSLDLSSFETSGVTTMENMFEACSRLTSINLSSFDTSGVTNMSTMFGGCSSLTSLDLSSFDTSRVDDMSSMFWKCSSLASLDLSSFDTSSVTDMASMFACCDHLITLDLSPFDTSKVHDMRLMFAECGSLDSLDLSSFDTSNVTQMDYMFEKCSSLISLDLSSFETSNVEYMRMMFEGCSALKSLDLSCFNTSGVFSMDGIFKECSSLSSLKTGINWNYKSISDNKPSFSRNMLDESGASYSVNDTIPEGAHTYSA